MIVVASALLLCTGALAATSQETSAQAVESAAERTSVWSGVFTADQAARGAISFNASCVRCHALDAQGVPARMSGDQFWNNWADDPLDVMYTRIKTGMPNNAPDSLAAQTYADIVAFILSVNGVPPGAGQELTPAAVSHIQMVRRDGPRPVPAGALVAVVGCLTQTGGAWKIESASDPVRSRTKDITADVARADHLAPAGKSYELKFPLVPLASMRGQQVVARGLLLREPDGLNVEAVRPVGRACGT